MTESTPSNIPALSPARRTELRSRAHHLDPVVIIGDAGLTPAVLREINVHLKSHELIKIKVAGDDRDARAAAYDTICKELDASPVQHIGKTLIVYRPKPPESAKKKNSGRTEMPSKRKHAARKGPRRTKRSYQGSK